MNPKAPLIWTFGGVDPGLKGGLAKLEDTEGEEVADVCPMPLHNRERRARVDRVGVREYFSDGLALPVCMAVAVERVGTRPKGGIDPETGDKVSKKESAEAMVRFGQGQGEVLGVLTGMGVRHIFEVPSSVWKVRCGLAGLSKREVCKRAAKLWPDLEYGFYGPGGGLRDGLAEALFLAAYCRLVVQGRGIYDR